jgi:hypothetical protein
MNRFVEFEAAILVDQVNYTTQLIEQIEARIEEPASAFILNHCILTIPGCSSYISNVVLRKLEILSDLKSETRFSKCPAII